MKKYRVVDMNFSEEEANNLNAIGVSIGVELHVDENFCTKQHMCYIKLDNSVFCMRNDDLQKLILEEIK